MTTFNTGNPVPSSDGKDLSDNAETIDQIVNSSNTTAISRIGKTLSTIRGLESNYTFTAINGGIWATGQTFTAFNQFMVFGSTAYKPKVTATLPYIVGATPVGDSNIEPVDIGTQIVDRLNPDTLAIALADTNMLLNDVLHIKSGKIGPEIWVAVLLSSITPNGDNKIASTGSPTLALVKQERPLVYDIVIAYGQSNAVGYAGQPGVPAVDDSSTPTANIFAKNYDPATDSIIPISNTMNHLNYILESGGSRGNAWTAFSNTWYGRTGNGVVILNGARGGASISQLQKGNTNPVAPDAVIDADYYQRTLDAYQSTKAAMATQGYDQGGTYCVFHQGETDQQSGLNPVSYRNDLKQLALDMFVDFNNLSKFGVCIVGCPGSRPLESWQTIQSAQYSAVNDGVGGDIGRNMAVVFDGCPSFTLDNGQYNIADDTHYSQRGYNEMGVGAARGLSDWVTSDIDQTGNETNIRHRRGVTGAGYAAINKVSAIASFDGAAWSLLTDTNTGPTAPFHPNFVKNITLTGGVLRFILSGISPVTYDMSVELNDAGVQNSIFPTITKFTGTNEWGFDIDFRADLYFFVDTATGVILEKNPPAAVTAGSLIDLTVSATTDGTTATVTHPSTQSIPEAQYMATSAAEAGSVGMRVDATTTTRITATGASSSAAMRVRRVALTRSQVEGIGAFSVRISASVSDTQ